MFDDPNFFPFLQHDSWKGASACLVRPLVPAPGDLLITYGIAGENQNRYLTQQAQEESGYSAEDMHDQAVNNLRQRHGKIPWSPVTIGGEDVLLRTGDPVISSDVLNPRGMKKLSGAFAGKTVYLGIPSVFTVVASDDPDLLGGIVQGLHREAVKEKAGALSAQVYALVDGAIDHAHEDEKVQTIAPIEPAKFIKLVIEGIAGVAVSMARARGADDSSATTALWPAFLRKLGSLSPALAPLTEATPEDFATAVTSLTSHQRPIAAVRTLAKLARHGLPPDDGRRLANAAVGAALSFGQAGTGFFGVGRSLPKHLRLPLWGLAGLLGGDVP
jgi:hypothetical protein